MGALSTLAVVLLVVLITRFLGIHIFPGSSLAEDVWRRADVVESYIDRYYWKDDVSDQKISEYAAKGMVSALGDKYSAYFTEEELKETMNSVSGEYCGIGAAIRMDSKTGRKYFEQIEQGKPAEKAGFLVGDELLTVDGTDVVELTLTETVSLIKGEERKVELGIARKEGENIKELSITVTCEKIVNQSVSYKILENEIGYLKITTFNNETVSQFEKAICSLDEKGQKAMIMDVRDNGGGSLDAVIQMLDDLLPAGKLITEKTKAMGSKTYESTDEKSFDKPLAVLINAGSASASEVFAGTLQDRQAAKIIGVKSFGKGIVQTIFSLEKSCGGGIKLTTGEYLLPSGRSIHEVGLTPDIEVPYTGDTENYNEKEDNQLQKAVEVLSRTK